MSIDQSIVEHSKRLEKASWLLVFFAMLTQISGKISFPSYNLVLGFWGAYSSYTKHGRATFGLVIFSFLALLIDIIFCSITNLPKDPILHFSFSMFIICIIIKCYILYVSSHFFASLGGAYSMEQSILLQETIYDHEPPHASLEASQTAGFYPRMNESQSSLYTSSLNHSTTSLS